MITDQTADADAKKKKGNLAASNREVFRAPNHECSSTADADDLGALEDCSFLV